MLRRRRESLDHSLRKIKNKRIKRGKTQKRGAAELISIEESQSEEHSDEVDDSADSDSNNSQTEWEIEPSVWKISKVIVADDQILNI